MKYLSLLLLTVACQKTPTISTNGLATSLFVQHEVVSHEAVFAVENSYVYHGDELVTLYDLNASGEMSLATLDEDYKGLLNNQTVLPEGARFSYVIEANSQYENLVTRGSNIHLLTSADLINWSEQGVILPGNPDKTKLNHQQWNASHCYDENGDRQMIVEAGTGMVTNQLDVQLTHYINEVPSDVAPMIGGGNAWLGCIDGKGLLAIHGSVHGENGSRWIVRASILPQGEKAWKTLPIGSFAFAAKDLDVADPHLIELKDGRILMSMSFAQNSSSTFITKEKMSFTQLYKQIEGAL